MRLYSYELFAVSDFQGDVHVRPFPVNVFGIERLLVPAFEKVAFAANLTSSSSVATRHNPNKFGFCSHCSIGSQLCRHFHSCKTKCKRSSLVDVSIPGATIIRILLQRGAGLAGCGCLRKIATEGFHVRSLRMPQSYLFRQRPAFIVVVNHLPGHAAVDADVLTGDKSGLVGTEKEHHVGNLSSNSIVVIFIGHKGSGFLGISVVCSGFCALNSCYATRLRKVQHRAYVL